MYETYRELVGLLGHYGQEISTILLPEIPPDQITEETPVWVLRGTELESLRINLKTLMERIKGHSGGPIRMGRKGLNFGTSAIECYLSKTDSVFPGDVDSVVVDERNRIRGVIEYKKHTLADHIENHLIASYFYKDKRKYERLLALTHYYSTESNLNVPLIIFYYASNSVSTRLQLLQSIEHDTPVICQDSGNLDSRTKGAKTVFDWISDMPLKGR